MPPAIDFAEQRSRCESGQGQPILNGLDGAQPGECRTGKGSPLQLSIGFAAWQITGDALAGLYLDEFDAQIAQLVGSKASPKSQQHQSPVASVAQCDGGIPAGRGCGYCVDQPVVETLQDIEFQRLGTLFLGRVHGTDAFEHLSNLGGLGGIGKTEVLVPA